MAKEGEDYDSDENVYSEELREGLVDSDEISAEEEAFMAGYDEAEEGDSDTKKKKKKKKEEEEEEEPAGEQEEEAEEE